jgi:hypothetical protein
MIALADSIGRLILAANSFAVSAEVPMTSICRRRQRFDFPYPKPSNADSVPFGPCTSLEVKARNHARCPIDFAPVQALSRADPLSV